MRFLPQALLAAAVTFSMTAAAVAQDLRPLKYNHPGLEVDLGVGLWAWPIPCDVDGDGDYDLIVSCPDKPSNGIWYFRNDTGDTAQHKLPVFQPAVRLSSTVHYVMPSYVDGELRVLSPGWEYPDFTSVGTANKLELPIASNFYKPQGPQPKGPKVRHNQWRYVDYDGDGQLDIVVGIEDWSHYGWDDAWDAGGQWKNGPLHGFVFWFRNRGTTAEPDYAEPQQVMTTAGPVDVYGCPSPNFGDFDGDGDLDLLCGEFLDGFTYFENVGTRTEPRYATGRSLKTDTGERIAMDLQMIVPIAFDWDKDGDLDLIVGDEDGRVALVENTGRLDSQRTPIFLPPKYFQQVADELKCGALATPVCVDWDNDGDFDILSGNTAGRIEFFENLSGPGVEEPKWAAPVRLQAGGQEFRVLAGMNGSIQGPAEAKWGYTTLSIADWNHDGLPDIIFNSIWGKIQWLENIGTRATPVLAAPQDIVVAWPEVPPKPAWVWWEPKPGQLVTQWRTTPLAIDWNGDNLCDLVMLDHEGYLAYYEREQPDAPKTPQATNATASTSAETLRLLPPQRVFLGQAVAGNSSGNSDKAPATTSLAPLRLNERDAGGSGRRKLWLADWDGDGRLDLLANSQNADFWQQVKRADNQGWAFVDRGPLVEQSVQGHSTSPTVVDFNGDGILDLLIGAEDGRFYYRRNSADKVHSGQN